MGRHLLFVTHTSRPVDLDGCDLNQLTARYGRPDRLADLPPFESLPGLVGGGWASYTGHLSLHVVDVDASKVTARTVGEFRPEGKVQHANVVGADLVVCFEGHVEVFRSWWTDDEPRLDATQRVIIDDPWFAGVHTVFPIDDRTCVVSCSAPDAVVVLDVPTGHVVRRLRMPSALYGSNYDLTEQDSVHEHYIPNDLQMTHVNGAHPDGHGGVYVSALIPGDVGHFDAEGRYSRIVRGLVGVHGVRTLHDGSGIYFADSCAGMLVLADHRGEVNRRWDGQSAWMHDVQQLEGDVFALARSEHNVVSFVDLAAGAELGQLSFPDEPGSVQFLASTGLAGPAAR